MPEKKLIIVSNREPYSHRKHGRIDVATGGLTTALDPILRENHGIWIAWGNGEEDRLYVNNENKVEVPPEDPSYTLKRVWLTDRQIDDYYNGYSNRFLWPLCHMVMNHIYLKRSYWNSYKRVNQLFAEAVVEETDKTAAAVWLQDYHLALCAGYIKKARPSLPVSIFWHIPWPPYDIFRICPQRSEIIAGMLASDLIGFQLEAFTMNFINCAERELGAIASSDGETVCYEGKITRVKSFPISIDFSLFESKASSSRGNRIMTKFIKDFHLPHGINVGIGVDRLDYTKGLIKRLDSITLLFAKYPRFRGKFTFIQVAVPTRKVEPFISYKKGVENKIRDINMKYGTGTWFPIIYLDKKLNQEKLSALYRLADIAIISSIYDGMNLVSKEYIASQVDEKGVLLISEFAGASEEIPGATLINPYDIEGCTDAIKRAIEKPFRDKLEDIRKAREYVKENNIFKWVKNIIEEIASIE